MGKWIYKNTPYRNIVGISSDFVGGHDSIDAFKAGFQEAGGKVIKEVYPKLGTMDFAPFLAAIDVKGADAVYAPFFGIDAIKFVQQYQEFGLKNRLPLFGFVTLVDEQYLPSMGDAAIGIISIGQYPLTLDTPQNRAFHKAYETKFKEPLFRYVEMGYAAAKLIGAVAESLKGEVEDTPRVAKEMRRIASKVDAPAGSLEFDQYNQRIVNMYVMRTEKRDGKLNNYVIGNLGKISQADTWKWWHK
jgi:branched-chain amino acid transport system substrate-binding protein